MNLTITYVTARQHPRLDWFLSSLARQVERSDWPAVIIVDYNQGKNILPSVNCPDVRHVSCKPNVWQGPHRLTPGEWWATSAYRNTGMCLCRTEWIAFCDDRSVLLPGWLAQVKQAMKGHYAVAGSYEKVRDLVVEGGVVKSYHEPKDEKGRFTGKDPRHGGRRGRINPIFGPLFFGCTTALPLEWALNVNGYDESCDSLGLEDCIFGNMLQAHGYKLMFDPKMKILEDRTPEFYEACVRRTDKGVSPNDKSHGLLARTKGKARATHHWDLRQIREQVLAGQPFPVPTEPTHDWWDGRPLAEFP